MALLTSARPSTSSTSYDVLDDEEIHTPCETDPEMWFSDNLDDQIAARSACADCPFITTCLSAALDHEGARSPQGRFGIWGGHTPTDRANLARRQWRGSKGPRS